jgi:hypothetical protein
METTQHRPGLPEEARDRGRVAQARARRTARKIAESAWLTTLEERIGLLRGADEAPDSALVSRDPARLDAVVDYYASLARQAQRAMHGESPVPEVPKQWELEFVDGWLVWKGRPVWWSGQRASGASPAVTSEPADVSAVVVAPARERRRLRRLLALPWRRAAA